MEEIMKHPLGESLIKEIEECIKFAKDGDYKAKSFILAQNRSRIDCILDKMFALK